MEAASVAFGPGPTAVVPIAVRPLEQVVLAARQHVPANAESGSSFLIDLLKREEKGGRPIGGLAVEVRVRER